MKILKEGARYQGTCPNCGCVFECTKYESWPATVHDRCDLSIAQSDAGVRVFNCPECKQVTKIEKAGP